MCGFFGIITKDKVLDIQVLEKATTLIRHRGPDDEGYLLYNTQNQKSISCKGQDTTSSLDLPHITQYINQDYQVGLGFRRLAIIDISASGHQPMVSADGNYAIVFNGEIYNYRELREELKNLGCYFSSNSDSEVLLQAYIKWGKDSVLRFKGMFSFCILDKKSQQLLLARDFFGIKPLYYSVHEQGFTFGSEIKSLLNVPFVSTNIQPQLFFDYLAYGMTDHKPETMLEAIKEIPPAHYLTYSLKEHTFDLHQYWSIPTQTTFKGSIEEAAAKFRALFLNSIDLHLRSDVPLGAALSGGIDSSAIASSIKYLNPDVDLKTFSYIADDEKINEKRYAELVEKQYDCTPNHIYLNDEDLLADIENLVWYQDLPFASTSIYAQSMIFKRAAEKGIKVMLDGQGADEYMAGYPGFSSARVASLMKQKMYYKAFHEAKMSQFYSQYRLCIEAFVRFILPTNISTRIRQLSSDYQVFPAWIQNKWIDRHHLEPTLKETHVEGKEVLKSYLQQSIKQALPVLLRYEDRNSMRFSIESRVPFLLPELIEFVLSLPEEMILFEGQTKYIFRKAMQGIVPDEILNRQDKIGFKTTQENWMQSCNTEIEAFVQENAHIIAQNKLISNSNTRWRLYNLKKWANRFDISFQTV